MSATVTAPAATVAAPVTPKVSKVLKSQDKKFRAIMSVAAARLVILNGCRAVKFGGATQRGGALARHVIGVKFGKYLPSEVMDAMRKPAFQADFAKALEDWRKGWDAAVTESTQKMRENQYKACTAFMGKDANGQTGFERVADAIESMLAARCQQVNLEDDAGNVRPRALVDATDTFLGINHTSAREAGLRFKGVA